LGVRAGVAERGGRRYVGQRWGITGENARRIALGGLHPHRPLV
jgi:hypothetical protein